MGRGRAVGIMPYRLEKGLFPKLIEDFFNEGLDDVDEPVSVPDVFAASSGARRRLRAIWRYCAIGAKLRAGGGDLRQVTKENSFIKSAMFDAVPEAGLFRDSIAENWLGMERDASGAGWQRPARDAWPTDPAAALPTTGHWTGYYGNVELILVEALQRMLEVSLGVPHLTKVPKTPAKQAKREEALLRQASRVWPVYLFLTCPQPWFESWVTWQRHSHRSPLRGQVTVMLSTPGHGRPVAPSPVDLVGDTKTIPGPAGQPVANPYYLFGVDDETRETGYRGKVLRPSAGVTGGIMAATDGHDPEDTFLHDDAGQGMWVVTHENHDSTVVWTSFTEPEPGTRAWDLPPIAHYRCAPLGQRKDVGGAPDGQLGGYDDIVVVSPAGRDGGIPVPNGDTDERP